MEVAIEIVTRGEKVLSLHKFSGQKVTIGRAYDNDLVLQEEHICPHHATLSLDENGDMQLTDISEINGIKDKHSKPLGKFVKVSSGDVFVLGKMFIRVLQPNHAVTPAKRLNIFEDISRSINHWYWALLTVVVFYCTSLLQTYLDNYHQVFWSKLTVQVLFVVLACMLLPLFIAIVARIFKKDVRFFGIVVFSFAILLSWQAITSVGNVLLFNWGGGALLAIAGSILEYGVFAALMWGSFYLASNLSLQRISLFSVGLTVLLASVMYLNDKGEDKVVLFPQFSTKILPTSLLFATPESVDVYIEDTTSLFVAAAEEAKRRNKEADEQ